MTHFTYRLLAFVGIIFATFCVTPPPASGQVLFDNTKSEVVANANWIIDTHQPIPSPSITGITASTSETYWNGALSSWGVALAKLRNSSQITLPGNGLETLPITGAITYGNSSNAQDLSHYQVYVVCEPNIRFTDAEKTAILNFVANGGGLFMVADHTVSDRNNDGWDSLMIWNDLMTNNTVQTNPFGFIFNTVTVTPGSTSVDNSPSDPLIHGIAGTVTKLTYSSGTTMTINNTTTTHAAVWSTSSTTGVMALYGTYGSGRFAAIGDSSVVEDSTSSSGKTYDGWTTPVDNGYCAINGTVWLLGGGTNTPMPATATTGTASGVTTTAAVLNGTVNPNGQSTTALFQYGLTTSYGSTASVSGSLTGTNTQAVSAGITNLTSGTTYHFRVTATNAAGLSPGVDQTFTTTASGAADLAITATHTGNFTQGDTGDIYTIAITNIGSLTATGMVTMADTLPASLTATAISGNGWATNLATLTCTRSDPLAAGAGYPPITVTVRVATNAPASVTNTATVSGGGDTNLANNTANDPTTINTSGGAGGTNYSGILAGWDMSGQSNFGTSPLAPTTNAPNLTVGGLTRGSGVGTSGSATPQAWGGTTWNLTSQANAVTANAFATFSIVAKTGFTVSFASISEFDYRRSGTGPPNGELQYQVGAGAFTDIAAISYTSTTGAALTPIDLSGITALQNVSAGTTITFRIVNWGASSSGGTWYVLDVASSSAPDFAISGTVAPLAPPAIADLAVSAAHAGTFTQGDHGDSYTLTVTNIGTAATAGAVSVVDTLPAGLTATAISGDGWSATLTNLTCTRSDALPAGSNYPPITVTVNVLAGAPTSVTNIATVSGGGDVSSTNNTASDPTTIVVAAAPTTTTGIATALGTTTATLNGMVNPNKQAATAQFQYGTDLSYGSVAVVSGTLTGSTAQAVSASLTGLLPGTTYHFRVAATNVLGSSTGLDQTFNTAVPASADLAITASHVGNFTQGDLGDTYTLVVTNLGNAPSSSTVTVVDTLPAGLTATAISGAGWTTNLGTLTCTRTDALAVGAAYPPITITVSVAANAATSITNVATVSGGGDVSPANNTASDLTAINAAAAPIAITGTANGLGTNTATLNGAVNPNGQSATVQFQYGLTTDYGSNATIAGGLLGTTAQPVSTNLPGLMPGTTYHFRVAATNILGANVGQDQVFTTLTPIEAWRFQWFGTTTNSGAAADTAVGTSDSMPNLLKYALGLDPLVATNDPVAGDISTGYLRLIVPKNPDATDVTFQVEVTSDVTTASWTTNGTTVDTNTPTLLQVHADTPVAASDGAFIRLRVSRP